MQTHRTGALAEEYGSSSVRVYPRDEGPLSQVQSQIRADIPAQRQHHQHSRLTFILTPHEDLKSHGLAALIATGLIGLYLSTMPGYRGILLVQTLFGVTCDMLN